MAAVDCAIEADIDLPVPVFRRRFDESLPQHQTGIIDQNIQPAEIGLDARHHGFDGFEIGDVGLIGPGLAAGLLNLRDDGVRFVARMVVVDRDRCPCLGEGERDRRADIPAAAGHERDAPCKIVHCWFPFIFMQAFSSDLKSRSGVTGKSKH